MTEQPRWQQVGGTAVEVYARQLVPAMFAPWAPLLIQTANLQPSERVIDIACGTGVVTQLAAERVGPTGRVVGLDINGAMLAVAESQHIEHGPVVEWLLADAQAIPLPDASFDVALCQQGLQQFPDRLAALREMRRLLVPGGRLTLNVWSQLEGSPGMAALVAALERHAGRAAADNRRAPFALSDATELRTLLDAAGFSEIEVRTKRVAARFSTPEALVEAQLAATPLAALGEIDDATRTEIRRDVRASLERYIQHGVFAVPMEAHVAFART